LTAILHGLRSSAARCSSVICLTHRSNAELGPALIVPRYRVIASSQRNGRCRNATGGIEKTGKPE
jgi:hypothetical protein